jgi:glycine cleavage system aminomethyltransferase T
MLTDATSIYAGFALLGPRVPDLLSRLVTTDPSRLQPGHCLATQLLRLPAILLRRELPVMVVETYVPSEFASYAWDAIFAVAQPLAPEPAGLDALRAEGWR